jgi:hypothetical protein
MIANGKAGTSRGGLMSIATTRARIETRIIDERSVTEDDRGLRRLVTKGVTT